MRKEREKALAATVADLKATNRERARAASTPKKATSDEQGKM